MDSQQIHGISREQLRNDGVDPYWLVEYLNATVPDVVYSDAVLYDQWWIDRIYKACHIERKFKIETTDRLKDMIFPFGLFVFSSIISYYQYVLYKRELIMLEEMK